MFDYLQKFNTLPQNLRDSVSSPAAMTVISNLENKYKVDLAATVMKVMTKIIPLADLSIYFVSDFALDQETAKKLTSELKEKLFFPVANYLGYNASYSSVMPKTVPAVTKANITPAPIYFLTSDKIIKELGINFSSLDLNYRLKNILDTYLKGIRNRVDARLTLGKEVVSGGLGLDQKVIDKIFKLCDEVKASHILPSGELELLPTGTMTALPTVKEPVKSGLETVRALYEKPSSARDIPYNLQSAIAKGEIKKPVTPLNLPTPEEAKEKLLVKPITPIKPIAPIAPITPIAPIKPIEPAKIIVPAILTAPLIPVATVFKAAAVAGMALKAEETVKIPITSKIEALNPPVVKHEVATKLVRPPEKKVNFFSKLFGAKKKVIPTIPTIPTVPVIPKIPVPAIPAVLVAPVIPTPVAKITSTPVVQIVKIAPVEVKASPKISVPITTLRTAAAAPQIDKTIKSEPVVDRKIPDIVAPKIMGPLEELRYLSMVNFHRLGTTPEEITTKIESKIRLLEKDGYDHMISGVLAWRENSINLLYLKMGLESLNKGLSFKQYAINCQTVKNDNFLTWEEIGAIIKLNSRLMF